MVKNLQEKISFINISTEDYNLLEWKPPRSFRSFILDMNIIKDNTSKDVFFHLNKGNMKIVYIRKKNLILTIGSNENIQYQLLEVLLEQIDKFFNEMYDVEVILSYGNVSENIFSGFKPKIADILENFDDLDIGTEVNAYCRVCNSATKLFIKRSMITNADSYPVPIVFTHRGHAILCYIDKNYEVRGVELVNITG